jgi:serine/threonine protein kinase
MMSWKHRLAMLHDTAAAMAFLHSRHVAHGDLRSANLFLAKDGSVRLGDFGLVSKMGADSGARAGPEQGQQQEGQGQGQQQGQQAAEEGEQQEEQGQQQGQGEHTRRQSRREVTWAVGAMQGSVMLHAAAVEQTLQQLRGSMALLLQSDCRACPHPSMTCCVAVLCC